MASDEKDWNLQSRLSRLLGKKSCSDVEFLVGVPPRRHLCHRVVLAAGSEVFEAMFYGPLGGQKGPVRVPDVTSRGFAHTIRYLYSDTVSLRDELDALETAYSAKKYMVTSLFDACETFLIDRVPLGPENVLDLHEQSSLLGMERLRQRCLRYVSRNAREVFHSKSYRTASRDVLEDVLGLDLMDIESEREVMEALWTWGEQRCAEEGVRTCAENVRRYTGQLLKHVRFFAMRDLDELSEALGTCQLLDTSEELALLWSFAMPRSGKEPKVPSGICTKSRTRSISNSSRIPLPGRYLYDGSMTSYLIEPCRMRADMVATTGSPVTVIGAVIAFKPVPCYSGEDRSLDVELLVTNRDTKFRSDARAHFRGAEETGGREEVEREVLLDDYVVIEGGHVGSLTVTVSGEGVRLMRRTQDAVPSDLLRLKFVPDEDGEGTKEFMPIKELMIV